MSRSYKHIPGYTCDYGTKQRQLEKERASRRVRRSADVINGMMYKKLYDSWDICDYKLLFFNKQDYVPSEVCRRGEKWPCIKDARKAHRAWCAWRK
jgi:hypothetical protein